MGEEQEELTSFSNGTSPSACDNRSSLGVHCRSLAASPNRACDSAHAARWISSHHRCVAPQCCYVAPPASPTGRFRANLDLARKDSLPRPKLAQIALRLALYLPFLCMRTRKRRRHRSQKRRRVGATIARGRDDLRRGIHPSCAAFRSAARGRTGPAVPTWRVWPVNGSNMPPSAS